MLQMPWDRMTFSQERIYVFTLFNSLYAFLPFWIVANLSSSQFVAALGGLGVYILSFPALGAVMKWMRSKENALENIDGRGLVINQMMLTRLFMGNVIILLACIFGITKSRAVAYGGLEIWQIIVGFIFFVGAYLVSSLFVFIKPSSVGVREEPLIPERKEVIADVPSIQKIDPPLVVKEEKKEERTAQKPAVPLKVAVLKPAVQTSVANGWDVFSDVVSDQRIRQDALLVLRRTPEWPNVVPSEESYNKKGSACFQQAVIRALGDAKDPLAIPFLVELLGKAYDLSHGQEEFRRPLWPNMGVDAASALARIGKPSAELLLKALRSPERLVRLYAVYGIALLRDSSLRAVLAEAAKKEEDVVVATYFQRTLAQFERSQFVAQGLSDLKLAIEPALVKLRVGEPVRFYWIIHNNGLNPVVINIASLKVIKQIFSVKAIQGQTPSYLSPYDSDSAPSTKDLVALQPGAAHRVGSFDIRESFDFSKPGPYEIQGVYQNRFPGIEYGIYVIEGRQVSDPVVIEVGFF